MKKEDLEKNKNIKKEIILKFEDFNVDFIENGDVHFYDKFAEHMIYVEKEEFRKIIKKYISLK